LIVGDNTNNGKTQIGMMMTNQLKI
jgi:hypothetical protein